VEDIKAGKFPDILPSKNFLWRSIV
jgi:hypothetical protein